MDAFLLSETSKSLKNLYTGIVSQSSYGLYARVGNETIAGIVNYSFPKTRGAIVRFDLGHGVSPHINVVPYGLKNSRNYHIPCNYWVVRSAQAIQNEAQWICLGLFTAAVMFDSYRLYKSYKPEGNEIVPAETIKAAGSILGAWTGGFAAGSAASLVGAKTGAIAGLAVGPIGSTVGGIVGAVAGGLAGGLAGGSYGSKYGELLAQNITPQVKQLKWPSNLTFTCELPSLGKFGQ